MPLLRTVTPLSQPVSCAAGGDNVISETAAKLLQRHAEERRSVLEKAQEVFL